MAISTLIKAWEFSIIKTFLKPSWSSQTLPAYGHGSPLQPYAQHDGSKYPSLVLGWHPAGFAELALPWSSVSPGLPCWQCGHCPATAQPLNQRNFEELAHETQHTFMAP